MAIFLNKITYTECVKLGIQLGQCVYADFSSKFLKEHEIWIESKEANSSDLPVDTVCMKVSDGPYKDVCVAAYGVCYSNPNTSSWVG